MILDHQAEHHRDDDPHDPLAVGADIVVDVHHDRQHAQQRQRGQQRQRRLIVADEEHAEIVMMKSKGPHREQNGRRDQQRDEHKSAAVRALLLLDPHRSVSFSFPYRQNDTGSDSDCQSAVRKTAGHIREDMPGGGFSPAVIRLEKPASMDKRGEAIENFSHMQRKFSMAILSIRRDFTFL